MADYKIRIGAELDTNSLNNAVKSYKAPKQIELKAKLDTSKINDKIQNYKASKQIELIAKLNTKNIDDKIRNYKAPKQIELVAQLDSKNIDNVIKSYNAKTPIRLDVKLDNSNINEQIKSFKTNSYITVKAKLDDSAISEAIKNYRTKTPIKVALDLNPEDIDTKLKGYEPRNPLRVKVELNKGYLNEQIKNCETTNSLRVNAKLNPEAINNAIRNYKAQTPIVVDLKLGFSDIDSKIEEYKRRNSNAEIPVKLTPDKKSFNADLKNYKPSTLIRIGATLDPADINSAIEKFVPTSRIKVDVRILPKDINEQIRKIPKITEPLLVEAKLNEASVNSAISAFKPTSLFNVGVQLNTANINSQIDAFKPTSAIKVNVDLNNSQIDESAKKNKLGTPIQVDVKLNRENINEQIRGFITKTKVKVGIKLDFVGVAKQITDYKAKSKIKIGAEFDKNSVNSQIQAFKTDKPLELGVKLNLEAAKAEIEKLRNEFQKFGKIVIQFPNANAGKGVNGNVDGYGSGSNNENILKAANDFEKFTASVNNAKNVVTAMKGTLRGLGVNLKDVNAKNVTRDIQEMGIEVQKVTTTIKGSTLKMSITGIQETADGIKRVVTETREYEKAITNSANINKTFAQTFKTSADAAREFKTEVNNAFTDVKNITQQIGSLEIDLIGAEAKNDVREIENIKNRISELRIELERLNNSYKGHFTTNQNNSISAIQSGINYRKQQAQNKVANKSDVATIKELNSEMSKFVNLQSQISNMETKIKGLEAIGGKSNQVVELRRQLEELENTYSRLMRTFMKKLNANAGIMPMDDIVKFGNDIAAATEKAENKFRELDAKIADTKAKLANGINIKLTSGGFDNEMSDIATKFENVKSKSSNLKFAMDEVNAALSRIREASAKGSSGIDELIKANQDYENALKAVRNQLDINARAEREAAANQKLADDRVAFQSKIDAWLTKNSAAADKFGAQLLDLRAKAQKCDRTTLDHLESEFKRLDKEAEAAGLKMQTFGDRLKTQFQKYSSYLSVYTVIMYAAQAVRSMFEQVKLVDSAMTELKKVTDETNESYSKFLTNAASKAKEIGTTIDGLVASTADFARLGYGFEDSQKLAEVANIYAVVGDEIESVEDATQSLVSTLAAFKSEMNGMSDSDFAESIVDKMNEVSNNFAISSGGIGEALQRSASSMAAANNSLDETIALITAANTVAQNPEKVGNAFKTKNLYCLYVQKCA